MELVNIANLKSHLSDVIAKVNKTGKAVVIGKYGKPIAKIIPFSEEKQTRSLGFGKHLTMTDTSSLQKQVDAPVDAETLGDFYR